MTGLTADTAPTAGDIVHTVNDPGGTPANRKATIANLSKGLDAGLIPNTPAGDIAATDVQAAIDELDSDKLANLVGDTTPQLGGQLDVNGNALGDGTLELLTFTETGSAVNEINITNAATGNAPKVEASGGDTNIDLIIDGKGSGKVKVSNAYTLPVADGTVDQVLSTDGSGTMSFVAAGAGDMILASTQTNTGAKTFDKDTLLLDGSTSGNTKLNASAIAGTTTATLPATTGTVSVPATSAGAPGTTPSYEGEVNVDITNDVIYLAADTSSSGDWKQATGTEVTGTSGQLYVFNGSNVLTAVTMSGGATISNAGVVTLIDISGDTTPALGGALDGGGFDLDNLGVLFLTEQAAAEADVDGKGQFWVKTGSPNQPWFTNDVSTDFQIATLDGTESFTNKTMGAQTLSGTVTAAGQIITNPVIEDYAIQSDVPTDGATITLDYTQGPDFTFTLTQNTTLAFSNWPASGDLGKISCQVKQDSDTAKTVAVTNIDKWSGGTAWTMSTGLSATDELVFWTRDGGTTVYGAIIGQAFA